MASDNAMDALNPGKSRKTTDCACSILFILCWAGMLYIAIMGFLHGDPDRLLYGLDYKFDQCGKLNTAAGRGITSLNVNVALTDGNGTKPILLGGRDHTSEPMYYAVAPGGTRFPASYAGICAGVCPNANLERIGYKPSEWVVHQSRGRQLRVRRGVHGVQAQGAERLPHLLLPFQDIDRGLPGYGCQRRRAVSNA
ncbi:hypothetical protein T492DRAFT_232568 [Pavlovales sp. CCMP2436]|nr:hypothetical protein T492DRAFT_232568 [Pavlovales sp. CCMP2436]